jgi:predicted metal-dependent hydrolase
MPVLVLEKNILRTRRRTLELRINREGDLEVRAPINMPIEKIEEFIDKKQDWIIRKQNFVRENRNKVKERLFIENENFLYLGDNYPLKILDDISFSFIFKDNTFFISKHCVQEARDFFMLWYKKQAYNLFQQRLSHYSDFAGIPYKTMRINSAKTLWGSCRKDGNLSFNFKLIMAPLEIIDYIVVHELCHIRQKNHSQKFWDEVSRIIPNHKKHRAWLRKNQYSLDI